jgi:hypothetical protein
MESTTSLMWPTICPTILSRIRTFTICAYPWMTITQTIWHNTFQVGKYLLLHWTFNFQWRFFKVEFEFDEHTFLPRNIDNRVIISCETWESDVYYLFDSSFSRFRPRTRPPCCLQIAQTFELLYLLSEICTRN